MTKYLSYFLLLFYVALISCSDDINIFVSTQGNEEGNGTFKKPFSSIERAKNFIHLQRAKGNSEPFCILVRGGDYYFTQTLKFTDADSNLIIKPYGQEKVRFTGGLSVDPANALPVSGTENEKLFPSENRANILMVHLKKLGITDYGELHPNGFSRPKIPVWMELFVNDVPGHLARWPNDSSIVIGKILQEGSVASNGDDGNIGGKFTYDVSRPSKWKIPDDIWIFGFFNYGWADDAVKLTSIDTINKTFTTAQPHRYGFDSGKPYNKWYAYNIAEEIDMPGEYYIDRKEGILYFYNPGKIESIELSVFEDPFITINGSSNITVEGITFDCTRGIAAEMFKTENCIFQDCTFNNMGMYAVNINYEENAVLNSDPVLSKNNGLKNCTVCQTGSGGILLYGGNRKTLEASGNYVENCAIHDFNRISKTYCAGIKISGVGNRISHNELYNSPHAAILLSGNDHLIEYNEIHSVCMVTDDVGALYYGRNPSERGNEVKYNYFHHLGDKHRTTAVYHDDGACGMTVHGNIFYKAGIFPSLIGGGSDNIYTNNMFFDCPVGIKVDNRMEAFEWAKPMIAKGGVIEQRLNEIHYDQPPYSTKYPELTKYWDENPAFPKRNKIDGNIFVNVDQIILKVDDGVNSDKQFLDFSDNNLITDKDPGFVDFENQNFKLKESSEVFKILPVFEQIPFEKIGSLKSRK
ncbi:right-handed parallel beta-helix repeat-containing protein [Prolixibacteraceae bacterium Z1-6]|uniref:Right-handed parallel beta-helix repeat-containing protein n=1 Tax=Draconibacterium aestuarii TaxID=2998507 RepID=A0A9X3J3X1_9BACT|nr:right-handed parallel beta-helix repeat-containing protein [Prolixibacteraceae bacterium Z1-6]